VHMAVRTCPRNGARYGEACALSVFWKSCSILESFPLKSGESEEKKNVSSLTFCYLCSCLQVVNYGQDGRAEFGGRQEAWQDLCHASRACTSIALIS